MNDYVPPNNIEVEAALLGAMIRAPKVCGDVIGKVEARHFFAPEHAVIFDEIVKHFQSGKEVNAVTLKHYFDSNKMLGQVGGSEYLFDLISGVITIINAKDYAETIRDLFLRRELIECCEAKKQEVLEINIDVTAEEICADFVNELNFMVEVDGKFEKAGTVVGRIVQGLGKSRKITSTGMKELDRVMGGGVHSGRFYGFGGRFKSGKSFLLSSISYNMAEQKKPHVYLTLESSPEEIMKRMMARRMGINVSTFERQDIGNDSVFIELAALSEGYFNKSSLEIQIKPSMTLDALRSTLTQIGLSGRFDGVFVDYLQLVTGAGRSNLTAHYEAVSQTLAEMTKQYDIWIIAAAQLNSEGGVRHGEGMLLSCDQAYAIHKIEQEQQHIGTGIWLECMASRYTMASNVGSESHTGLMFDIGVGPHFRDPEPLQRDLY